MTTFISHSFENKPEFENMADVLKLAGVPYWNPAEVKPGRSLRDQLRDAVDRCSVCIFVATRKALGSAWCGSELGAFWGAGKPVIVYLAEPSLEEKDLPPIVQGDVWGRNLVQIAGRAKELIAEASGTTESGKAPSSPVGSMTVEQLQKLIVSAVSLAAATSKSEDRVATPDQIGEAAKGAAGRVLEGIRATRHAANESAERWRTQILWVDDRPENNVYERNALESMSLEFTLALSTQQAIEILAQKRFAAIISDMGRREGPREGYALLEAVRANDTQTPFFIYAGSNDPAHKREAAARGAQGSTNHPEELFDMVIGAVRSVGAALVAGP